MIFLVGLMLAVVPLMVWMEARHQKITMQYAKRVVGRRMYGRQSTKLPLKLNTSGVIPPIFASSIAQSFPLTIATFTHHPWLEWVFDALAPATPLYTLANVVMIFFFLLLLYSYHHSQPYRYNRIYQHPVALFPGCGPVSGRPSISTAH